MVWLSGELLAAARPMPIGLSAEPMVWLAIDVLVNAGGGEPGNDAGAVRRSRSESIRESSLPRIALT
jgi:hypothetical protein